MTTLIQATDAAHDGRRQIETTVTYEYDSDDDCNVQQTEILHHSVTQGGSEEPQCPHPPPPTSIHAVR